MTTACGWLSSALRTMAASGGACDAQGRYGGGVVQRGEREKILHACVQ